MAKNTWTRFRKIVAISAILLLGIFSVWLIHNKNLRYGSIYDYNGVQEETHLLKFEAGYSEIAESNIIFEDWFSEGYDWLIDRCRFYEIWDKKSDGVAILAISELLFDVDFPNDDKVYVARVSIYTVAVVRLTFSSADFHCLFVTNISDLHKASWWE